MHFPVTKSPTNPFPPAPPEIVRNFPTQITRDRGGEDRKIKIKKRRTTRARRRTKLPLSSCSVHYDDLASQRELSEDPSKCRRVWLVLILSRLTSTSKKDPCGSLSTRVVFPGVSEDALTKRCVRASQFGTRKCCAGWCCTSFSF